jgi:DNA-binding NtrC family response regulator
MTTLPESLPLWGMRALVVEPNQSDRDLLVATLTSAGLVVTAADSFRTAHTRLVRRPPTILVTEIRLGYHNGLHLAHIARWLRRQMILVVTSHYRDPVLTRDAAALGATFVSKPIRPGRLLVTLYRACRAALPEQYAGA